MSDGGPKWTLKMMRLFTFFKYSTVLKILKTLKRTHVGTHVVENSSYLKKNLKKNNNKHDLKNL